MAQRAERTAPREVCEVWEAEGEMSKGKWVPKTVSTSMLDRLEKYAQTMTCPDGVKKQNNNVKKA